MKDLIQKVLAKDTHPFIQFIKYGICGGLATGVDMVIFFFLAWKVFPVLLPDDWLVTLFQVSVEDVDEQVRALYYFLDKSIAFLFSNVVAYVTNFLWVFEPGRHSRKKEVSLFLTVSVISYVVGTLLGTAMVYFFQTDTLLTYGANIFASVMINYAGRKYFVFKG